MSALKIRASSSPACKGSWMRVFGLLVVAVLLQSGLATAHPVFLQDHYDISLAPDGKETWIHERQLLLPTRQDILDLGQWPLDYNAGTENIEVLEAYTQLPDGSRVPVAADSIHEQLQAEAQNVPAFSDMRTRVVVFPALVEGASIYLKTRYSLRDPLFGGQHSFVLDFDPHRRVAQSSGVLHAPAGLALQVTGRDLPLKHQVSGNEQSWSWSERQDDDVFNYNPDFTVDTRDFSRLLVASTVDSWQSLARLYHERTAGRSLPDPAIRQLASQIVGNVQDRHEQARLLYQWVSQNIRYVQVYIEDGYYVPHSAAQVVHNRYGDCKDKAVLLKALLAARGIDSSLVLLSLGERYALAPLPTIDSFNHVILYLPEWKLYADATEGYLPFGVLASASQGKQVLHVDDGMGVQTLPATKPEDNRYLTQTHLLVSEDGSMSGDTVTQMWGAPSASLRQLADQPTRETSNHMVQDMLSRAGMTGHGQWSVLSPPGLDHDEFAARVDFSLDQKADPDSFWTLPHLGISRYLQQELGSLITQKPQNVPLLCTPSQIEEIMDIAFPAGWQVGRLPRAENIVSGESHFHSSFVMDEKNHVLHARWQVIFQPGSNTCSSAQLQSLQPLTRALMRKDVIELL